MQTLFNDLGNDENGKPTFKPHLIKDLTEVILPGFFESVRYVPIPRIEYTDPMIDAIVENLVIESDNLTPNVLELGSDNYWRWGRKQIANKNKNKVMLSVSGIQMDLKDVSYYIKKKQGFPSVTDKGVMDIFMGGTGLSFKVAMETADKTDRTHFFKVNTVVVDIANMDIKLKQSNHKLLFKLFKPLLFKVIRPVIQKVVEKQVRDNIHKFDALAYEIKKEADRAQAEAQRNPDPEHIQNIYQRYATAAQQKLTKAKEKKDEVAADKKVNVAVTQQDSIFKNISLPGGISTKATEYKQLAAKGDKWESPVFSIGSARETSNLPKVAQISRKPHQVNKEGVRAPPNTTQGQSGYGQSGYDNLSGSEYGQTQSGYGQSQAGYGQSEAGYGQTGAGYGQTQPGYVQASSAVGLPQMGHGQPGYDGQSEVGYGQVQPGLGQSNSSAGFGTQVSEAFNSTDDYSLTPKPESTVQQGGRHTTLGENNPVLRGAI
ncbi:hypothetical protein LTR66_002609 [Elasticomyces elasticus]|nr:hypothetical protein LTR66_002609 [Elasticomyces elasticus]